MDDERFVSISISHWSEISLSEGMFILSSPALLPSVVFNGSAATDESVGSFLKQQSQISLRILHQYNEMMK